MRAIMRMLMNNLDPDVAENPDQLVVYGGTGRAARSWEAFDAIVSYPDSDAVTMSTPCASASAASTPPSIDVGRPLALTAALHSFLTCAAVGAVPLSDYFQQTALS